MLAYELALRETPTDKGLRFTVAYKYSTLFAPGLALFHYGELLEYEPGAATLNNAGLAAGELGLATTAVDHLRRAHEAGNTLAASNLASRLLHAGFRKEADDLLRSTLNAADVSARVYSVLADVTSSPEDEAEKLKTLEEAIGRVRRWRLRYAEAKLGDAVAPSVLIGQYTGTSWPQARRRRRWERLRHLRPGR